TGGEALELAGKDLSAEMPLLAAGREQPRTGGKRCGIGTNGIAGAIVDGDDALPSTLAAYGEECRIPHHRRALEPDQLRDAHAGRIEQLEKDIEPQSHSLFLWAGFRIRLGLRRRK